jgi:hypothetical protein
LSGELGVPAPVLLAQALQNARLALENLVLRVDLRKVLTADTSDRFRPMHQWARNRLIEEPRGVVDLPPPTVRELAALLGCSHTDLAHYLSQSHPTRGPNKRPTDNAMRQE